jgi:hypothetical protein
MNDLAAALDKLDERQFSLLLAAAGLIVVALVASYVTLPQLKANRSASSALAGLPSPPVDAALLASMLDERQAAIAERAQRLHGDMANLPVREIEAFVIDRLQRIAWQHEVTLEGVRPEVGETIDSFRELLFRLELTGRYADLYAWLQDMRAELGFVVIKEYRMRRVGDDSSDPLLAVEVTIASYRKERP